MSTTTASSSRRTIIVQADMLIKLRALQSKMQKTSENSVSFSKVIDGVLRRGLK